MSKQLIELYADGAEKLSMAVRGLAAEDLTAKPSEPTAGKWSIQELLSHLADSEGVFADRIKRVIAEENPQLLAFDENRWAEHLAYSHRDSADSLAMVAGVRKEITAILRHAGDSVWQRSGIHSAAGKMTLTQIVEKAIAHLDHHMEFVHAKRRAMGKEMW
ncbi:MAG TPA: DinB family protein [Tepidisphaeraceae bacterium]|jgi:uncharacterized damage-inducible protein DinB